ncbi:MAG: hypothetical protein FJ108_09975 [Deltaproteobacteria bacterium]|nr:hypothetical protein [Deltaproteobacteria bacterium]
MSLLPAAGLVMILVGVASHYATRSLQGFSAFPAANVALGIALVLVGAAARARAFRGFSGAASRRVALRALAIFAAGAIAAIGLGVASRSWTARLDLTVDRLYTLSDQTRSLCAELDRSGAVAIELVFFEDALLAKDARLLVAAYGAACPRVSIRDASRSEPPAGARALYTTTATTVIACRGGVCDPVGYPSERNITAALLRLSSERSPRVFFLIGHGEVDLASESDGGYSGLAALLRDQGFDVRALVGPAAAEGPAGADVLIAAAPERDLLPEEIALLDRWLESGGRMLVLAEPGLRSNLYSDLLLRWGFDLEDGVIVDAAASPLLENPSPLNLLVHLFAPYHPVSRTLSRRTMVLMPTTRPVALARKPQPDDRLERIAFATERARVDHDLTRALAGRSPARSDAAIGEPAVAAAGSYPRGGTGAAGEASAAEARIVVIGDRDFASNRLIGALYNRDLLLNAARWLASDESRIALTDKAWTPNQDPLTLQQTVAYFYFLAFALPEALLLLGIYAWWRQRA